MSTLSTYFPTGSGGGGSGLGSGATTTELFKLMGNNPGAADCPTKATNYCNGYITMISIECRHSCIWQTCPYCCCACTGAAQFNCCYFLEVYASRACKVEKGCWCILKDNELIGCHPLYWRPENNCTSDKKVDIYPTTDGGYVIATKLHDPMYLQCERRCYGWRGCNSYVSQLCCCQQCVTVVDPSVTCACSGTQTALPASTYHGIFWFLLANNRMSHIQRAVNADSFVCQIDMMSTGQNDAKYCYKCNTRFIDTNGIDPINDRKRVFGPTHYFAAIGTNALQGCTTCSEEGNCCRGMAMLFPNTSSFCMCICKSCYKPAPCCFSSTLSSFGFQNYQEYFYDSPNESAMSVLELPEDQSNNTANAFYTFCYDGTCANFFLGYLPMCYCHGGSNTATQRRGIFSASLCGANPCKIAVAMMSNPLCDGTDLSNSTTGCFHTSAISCFTQPRDLRLYMVCNCAAAGTDMVVKSSCQRGCGTGTCCAGLFYGYDRYGGWQAPDLAPISDSWKHNLLMVYRKGTVDHCRCQAAAVKLVKFNWQLCSIYHMDGQGLTCFETCVCLCNLASCDQFYCGASNSTPNTGYASLGLGPRFARTDHVLACDTGTCTVVIDPVARIKEGGGCFINCTSGSQKHDVTSRVMRYSSNSTNAARPCVDCTYCTNKLCPIGAFVGDYNTLLNGMAKFEIPNVCQMCFVGRTGARFGYCCDEAYTCCKLYTCEIELDDYSFAQRIYGSCVKLGSNCFWLHFTGCDRSTLLQNNPADQLWFWDHRSAACYVANTCYIPLPAVSPRSCCGISCVASQVFHDQIGCYVYILRGDAQTNTAGNPVYVTKFCYDTTGVLGNTTFCSEDIGKVNLWANCYPPLASANMGDSTYPYRCGGLIRCCQAAVLYTNDSTLSVVEWGDT